MLFDTIERSQPIHFSLDVKNFWIQMVLFFLSNNSIVVKRYLFNNFIIGNRCLTSPRWFQSRWFFLNNSFLVKRYLFIVIKRRRDICLITLSLLTDV